MEINIRYETLGARGYGQVVRKTIKQARALVRCSRGTKISIVFIGDKKMRRLNRVYRGKDNSTNVLSFDTGDIFISVPFAKREAKKYGWTLKYGIVRLALHGFLHLAGYDHENEKEAKGMEEIEEKVLRELAEYNKFT